VLVFYLFLCLACGFFGAKTRMGFLLPFLGAALFTPMLCLLVLIAYEKFAETWA
jgi:hypothetical protein